MVPTVFEPSNLPLQNVTYVTPFGTPDPVLVTDVIDRLQPGTFRAWRSPGTPMTWNTSAAGFALDNYYLLTTFPVTSLDDLEGRKIGAPGPAVELAGRAPARSVSPAT